MQFSESAIQKLLSRNIEGVIERNHLEGALHSRKKLRIKHGIDPTGDKIHIGRAVALWKLKEFQDLGHKVVLIIGDFTAQIGDPSDKLGKRPGLQASEIKKNLKNYLPQIGKILDLKKCEVRHNSEWLAKLKPQDILKLAGLFTAQQMIERRNFSERWKKHEEIGLNEFMYPLMQGYDSVAVNADVEIGGADQLFNLLAGRKIQEHYGQKPQDILTTPMLTGTDGRKMSTSWGNVVNIADAPGEQYGKLMAMHDDYIVKYLTLATDLPQIDKDAAAEDLRAGQNPKTAKERVAFEIVKRYHGEAAAKKAAEHFRKTFSERTVPVAAPPVRLLASRMTALELAMTTGALKSKGEARRLIEQGGFDVDGKAIKAPGETLELKNGDAVKVGKRKFFKVELQ